jgi:hypothetical protein
LKMLKNEIKFFQTKNLFFYFNKILFILSGILFFPLIILIYGTETQNEN